ncbi:microtubule-associated protein 9 isoform X2 [Microcaecilia unicolor]|uniref:Microtubule-associated protein 9 isoform X2 n=1 Tax=Microcaecilia unicolor TaxID=1415580 RepID=A0A6P7WWA0_9AMPH|nr:microtubule-associated protein 9 isoform X2 [Microcaecilia unicolor]
MSDDEDFSSLLAYTKSPKASKRSTFQDELQKAIAARVARQQATEEPEIPEYFDYSDEFEESDDDEFLKDARTGKAVYNNFQLSEDEDEELRKESFMKSKSPSDSKGSNGLEYSTEKGLTVNRCRVEGGPSSPEQQKEWKTVTQEEVVVRPVPIPRSRDLRTRSTPPVEGTVFSTLDETFIPTPHQRTMLRKNSPIEEKDATRTEDRVYNVHSFSVSAPSSLTRLNDRLSVSEKKSLSESFSSEDLQLSSPPSVVLNSKHIIASTDDISGDSILTAYVEEPYAKDLEWQENEAHNDQMKLSGNRSPSVLELMMSAVYEKSKLQEKCLDDLDGEVNESFQRAQTVTPKAKQRVEHFIDFPVKEIFQDKYEQNKIDQKTMKNETVKNKEKVEINNMKNKDILERMTSPSTRIIKSAQSTKTTGVSKSSSVKSRYLGTLMVLDNKQLEKSASDLEEADALRATVYQDGGTKKDEALASFKSWKAMKAKELQKSLWKLKDEEDRRRKEMEELSEKREQSKKAFDKWREDKEDVIREKSKKERQAEIKKKRKEQECFAEKKKANISAIKKWNEKKEDALKQRKKDKLQEKLRQDREKAEKEEKEKKALEVYERWLENKERREISKKQKKLQVILEDEPPPPWSPPSTTVPVRK